MKLAGYIGTALSFLVAAVLMQYSANEFTRFLTWVVPAALSALGWLVSFVLQAKKVRDLIKGDINSMVARTVQERVGEVETRFSEIAKTMQEQLKDVEARTEQKIAGTQSAIVDEVWNRLDTIMNLKKIGAELAKDHDTTEPQS